MTRTNHEIPITTTEVLTDKELTFKNLVISAVLNVIKLNKKVILLFDIDNTIGYLNKRFETIIRDGFISAIKELQTAYGNSLTVGLLSTRSIEELQEVAKNLHLLGISVEHDFVKSSNSKDIYWNNDRLLQITNTVDDFWFEDMILNEPKLMILANLVADYSGYYFISFDDYVFEDFIKQGHPNIKGIRITKDLDLSDY